MSEFKIDTQNISWLRNKDFQKLMSILNKDGLNARVVGGAVRDTVANLCFDDNLAIGDIDIACGFEPLETVNMLENAGIKVVPTGIKYGTVTAVFDKNAFEITTLRCDVKTNGRHAEVAYTNDWLEDAKRRDFTINSLYMDIDGSIFDPFDGILDLKARRVKFIGDPEERIKEDALRILRFYRFLAQVGDGQINEDGYRATILLKHMINGLSGERIWQEFSKILGAVYSNEIIRVMHDGMLLNEIITGPDNVDSFCRYVENENKFGLCDILGRLSSLLEQDVEAVDNAAKLLKLSNKQIDTLKQYAVDYPKHELDRRSLRKVTYERGKNALIYHLCRREVLTREILDYIRQYEIPVFPLQGKDMIARGLKPGKEMGAELKRLERLWIENDFELTKY